MEMTLEQWGAQLAQEQGYDPANPAVQQKIADTVATVRAQAPGMSDGEIIKRVGPMIQQSIQQTKKGPGAPAAAPVGVDVAKFQADQAQLNQTYSPEAEAKVRDKVRRQQMWNDAGRALGSGARIAAGAGAQAALDRDYQQMQASAAAPLEDWQSKKAAAQKLIEQQIKTGEMSREQIKFEMMKTGFDQVQQERATAQAKAAAEADPASGVSDMMRGIVKQRFPNFKPEGFERMSYAQLNSLIPGLEKQFEQELKLQAEKVKAESAAADRTSRERVAATGAAARTEAARIAAAARDRATAARGAGGGRGGPAGLKPSEALAYEKEETKLTESLQGARETVAEFNRLEKLLQGGTIETGPIAGSRVGSMLGKLTNPNRQAAESVVKNIVSQAAKTFGGNPTEGERQYIEEANSVLSLDEPLPRLAELRSKFETLVREREARLASVRQAKGGGAPSAPAAGGSARMKDRSGKIYNIPRDKVQEAISDGLLPAE